MEIKKIQPEELIEWGIGRNAQRSTKSDLEREQAMMEARLAEINEVLSEVNKE